jgi:hypothetical protein
MQTESEIAVPHLLILVNLVQVLVLISYRNSYPPVFPLPNLFTLHSVNVKVKLSMYQAVEAHAVVRRRGSHIF